MAIVVINKILKVITIKLVSWIGYDTNSEMITKISNGVFWMQFANTALILVLVFANFSEIGLPGSSIFDGPFYDYTDEWYN